MTHTDKPIKPITSHTPHSRNGVVGKGKREQEISLSRSGVLRMKSGSGNVVDV